MTKSLIELSQNIDFFELDQKFQQLTKFYKNELSGVVRYFFDGLLLPMNIQDEANQIRKEYSKGLTQNTHIINGNQLKINLIIDKSWGKHGPITEFERGSKKYRSVPNDGDVYNHQFSQRDMYFKYVDSLIESDIISKLYGDILKIYHTGHDIPEGVKGDYHVDDKDEKDAIEESEIIIEQIEASNIYFNKNQKEFSKELFKIFEDSTKIFKGGEIVNYINNAMSSRDQEEYYNAGKLFPLTILENSFGKIANKSLIIPSLLNGQNSIISLREIPYVKNFANQNLQKFQQMLDYGMKELNHFELNDSMKPFKISTDISDKDKRKKIKEKLIELQGNIDTFK